MASYHISKRFDWHRAWERYQCLDEVKHSCTGVGNSDVAGLGVEAHIEIHEVWLTLGTGALSVRDHCRSNTDGCMDRSPVEQNRRASAP